MDTNAAEEQTKAIEEMTIGSLYQTGGHRLVHRKPIFTRDSKYLLVCSGDSVRRYVVETGAFIASHHFGHRCEIISIQLMPFNMDEVMVISSDGFGVIWNLSDNTRVDKFKLKLESYESVTSAQLVSSTLYFVIASKTKAGDNTEYHIHYTSKGYYKSRMKLKGSEHLNPAVNSFVFCPISEPKYCVSVHKNALYIFGIPARPSSLFKRHLIKDDYQLTCVASHPTEQILATGDTNGRIIIWNNFAESNTPSRSILHWHQWPVADLCFSPEGTTLYSVGAESVLVQWNLSPNHFGKNNFIPRLGMPLKYVVVDYNHQMIVLSHEDNTLQVVGPQMKGIRCVIEGMCLGTGGERELTTGVYWNSKMRSLAMNGRIGHIQFYSTRFQKQLFQLDVVSQNLVSSSKEFKVYPIEVTKMAVSSDGQWLSTIEMRDDFETLPEIRLKFWELKDNFKNYFLNTTIHLPHYSEVNYIEFSPDCEAMVSTSTDREFKIWHLLYEREEQKKYWNCFKVGNLNSLSIPTIAKWSSDSSLLAIAFDNFITLWDVFDKSVLKFMTRLSVEEKSDSKLIFVDFGSEDKSHLLVEGRHYLIKIWNLIDLRVIWTHSTTDETISCISLNKWENKFAVVSDQRISFFSLNEFEDLGSVKLKPINGKIMFGLFTDETPDAPDSGSKQVLDKTKFYCLNDKQELFEFAQNEPEFAKTQVMEWDVRTNDIMSPIALMLIHKKHKKEAIKTEDMQSFFKTNKSISKLVNDMLFNVPSHVLPPINILCKTFLQSLNDCREKEVTKDEDHFKSPNDLDLKPLMSKSYDILSDVQSNSTYLDTNDRENETIDDESEDKTDFNEEDYSWLQSLRIKEQKQNKVKNKKVKTSGDNIEN